MVFSGTYKQKYVINKESKELVVEVKLHEREGMIEASQNLYYGTATANGKEIQHKNLLTCVNGVEAFHIIHAKKTCTQFQIKIFC